MSRRKKIRPGEKVPVHITGREKKLLDELLLLDDEYVKRFRKVDKGGDFVGEFTLGDLDDFLGWIAAEANHAENPRKEKKLDDLYGKIAHIERLYDDRLWNGDKLLPDDPVRAVLAGIFDPVTAEALSKKTKAMIRKAAKSKKKPKEKRPTFWSTDLGHFLDENGEVHPLPASTAKLVEYFGSIVAYTVSLFSPGDELPPVRCRRRPNRKACRAMIQAIPLPPDGLEIQWACPVCRDAGLIKGWRGTPWEKRGLAGRPVTEEAEKDGAGGGPSTGAGTRVRTGAAERKPTFSATAMKRWESIDPSLRMRILNNVFCSRCGKNASMELLGGRMQRKKLVLKGRCVRCGRPVTRIVESE